VDHISDVARGPGWWLASDGKWYPPEARPPVQVAPAAVAHPTATPGPKGVRASRRPVSGRETNWGVDYWTAEEIAASQRRSASRRPPTGFRRPVDPRGAFVAALSVLLLVACLLPYYRVIPAGSAGLASPVHYQVVAGAFGAWRAVLPAVAGAGVVIGVANWLMRATTRGAVLVFVTLRLLTLAQLGLWVLVAIDRMTTRGLKAEIHGTLVSPSVTVTWVAWAAIAVAVAAMAGSFASSRKAASA
jgi:hypothetical protein